MSVFFKKSYWSFLLKSTNAHGVHSPFVYDLVTRCFYKKRSKKNYPTNLINKLPKTLRAKHIYLLYDFIDYFSPNQITTNCKAPHPLLSITTILKKDQNTQANSADLIYIFQTKNKIDPIKNLMPNDVLIVEAPYKTPAIWDMIKKENFAQVIVDTYYFGFIFNRKQQAKEEFYIRL